jgi:hypothetical protein
MFKDFMMVIAGVLMGLAYIGMIGLIYAIVYGIPIYLIGHLLLRLF